MERRLERRIETRFEVVWAAGSLDGVGVLRNLSIWSAWIDEVTVPPPIGVGVRLVIVDKEQEEREPVLVNGGVIRRTSTGFAVALDLADSPEIGRLLDRRSL